ncbi:MAG: hypothetical protein IPF51_17115 [Dehalococcoidia bacterium]|uniref:hypothetical protein n=1 Tax=Candidatus Amarobacter glycogenicus TaxID=3140699 RepID=UPI003134F78F|nr:hypothetical protein [Dehalococcoidia bacterium]
MKYRALWGAAVGGLAIHFLGLGWDVYRHSSDSTLAQREDVLSLGNPSHLMIVVGMAIVAASLLGMAAAWMAERRLGGDGLPGAMVRGVSLPVISIVAGGSIWLASTAEDGSHDHGTTDHVHAPGTPEDHPHDSEGGPGTQDSAAFLVARQGSAAGVATHGHTNGAAAEEDSMGEGSAHTHGIEVAVSGEQFLAAGKFAAAVKEKTAKYIDVREALTAGYVQITPDLPGIAAHFIRSDYQRDGHEMDPERPEVLLYSKRLDGNWRLLGAMFMAESAGETPPSYFGAVDVWHRHENLCFTAGAQVRTTASAAECRGGVFVKATAYQMHVWVEPGGTGVFAHDYAPISPGAFAGATQLAASELRAQVR